MPVIYHYWQPIVLQLFEQFRDFGFSLSRVARYIEDQPYLFPYPPAEDLQRYMFVTWMTKMKGVTLYLGGGGDWLRVAR